MKPWEWAHLTHFTASVAERDFLVANTGWCYEIGAFNGYLMKW